MSKVNQLWNDFTKIEVELQKMSKHSEGYTSKKNELLKLYNKIQAAEAELVEWQTQAA